MLRWVWAVALWAVLLPASARADTADRLEAAFRGWVEEVGATAAVMHIHRKGRSLREVTVNMPQGALVETASLSKAITAVCAAHLIAQGVWRTDTTSHAVLGEGPKGITLAQLLTHQSGLAPDQTQGAMVRWLDKPGRRAHQAALRALTRPSQEAQQGAYRYNNENYAVLGAMIAAQTGTSYERFCTDQVLSPAGVTSARPSARSGRFLPWGGWQMTAADYGAFHWHAFGPNGIIGADPDQWPAADLGRGMQYGMGMFQRAMRGSHNYWHFGALCFPMRLNTGSLAVIWLNDYGVMAAYEACVTWDEMAALDAALVAAVFP